MAFVPLPVEKKHSTNELEWKRAGYKLMDEFFKEDGMDEPATVNFMQFLDKVATNIQEHPQEDKYRKLKVSSRGYEVVRQVKRGKAVMEFLGFRVKVEDFEEWAVLQTKETSWLQDFLARIALIHGERNKRKEAEAADLRKQDAQKSDLEKHKETVLARIEEQRAKRMNSSK